MFLSHDEGVDRNITPPRSHLQSYAITKMSPDAYMDEYAKSVSPYPQPARSSERINYDITPEKSSYPGGKSAQKEQLRKALENKFKNVFERSPSVKSGYKDSRIEARSVQRNSGIPRSKSELGCSSGPKRQAQTRGLEIGPAIMQKEPITPSMRSECSQCSGARCKGMEYICVGCENREMHREKLRQAQEERVRNTEINYNALKKLEEAQRRAKEEYVEHRQRLRQEMQEALQDSAKKKQRERIEKAEPTSTTIVNDQFGLDYGKLRVAEKEKAMEKVRRGIAAQIFEHEMADTTRKTIHDPSSTYYPTKEELFQERERNLRERRTEQLSEISAKKLKQESEKKRQLDSEKAAMQRQKALQEKKLEEYNELQKNKRENTREGLRQLEEQSAKKKRDALLQKESERQVMDFQAKQHQEHARTFYREREQQRSRLAEELKSQAQTRSMKTALEKSCEKQEAQKTLMKKFQGPDVCPHGKKYVCAYCNRSYPRSNLTKRPLK